MKAYSSNFRQSPRKIRLVSNLVKGKSVAMALTELNFLNKKASETITKLINSAVANAKENHQVASDDLFIKEIRVDDGPILKRMRPRARGSAFMIRKRTSHIALELGVKGEKKLTKADKKAQKKAEAKKGGPKAKIIRQPADKKTKK